MRADGRTALVTGGAVRLGRGICLALAERGCRLLVHYHGSADAARELCAQIRAGGGQAEALQADLGQASEVQRLFREADELGWGLDYLVNNAAIFERVDFERISVEQLERMWRLNAAAPFWCAQAAAPRMRRQGGGSIVNITDIASERPFPNHTHYCMSKAAVAMLTRSLALELAPAIRVNAVAPGAILFPEYYDEAKRASVLRRIPMAREGSVEEFAQAVVFLLLGPAFVTGQTLAVDGGRSARL
jgi:pteridine reductase